MPPGPEWLPEHQKSHQAVSQKKEKGEEKSRRTLLAFSPLDTHRVLLLKMVEKSFVFHSIEQEFSTLSTGFSTFPVANGWKSKMIHKYRVHEKIENPYLVLVWRFNFQVVGKPVDIVEKSCLYEQRVINGTLCID